MEENKKSTEQETPGGQGGPICFDDNTSGKRLIERAIKERWDIPEKYRNAILTRVMQDALNEKLSPRERAASQRVVLQMDRINLEAIRSGLNLNVNLSAEDIANLDDEQLDALIGRLNRAQG